MTITTKTTIYLGDNGRAYCPDHLGATAKATGRDLSGQRLYRVTEDDVREAERYGTSLACETCGRTA